MIVKEKIESIELLEDSNSPAEAYKLISEQIDAKVNRLKDEYWSAWELDNSIPRDHVDAKIDNLLAQKNRLRRLMIEAEG